MSAEAAIDTVKTFVSSLGKDNKKALSLLSEYSFLWQINNATAPTTYTMGQIIGLIATFQKSDLQITEIFASSDGKKVSAETKSICVLANGEPYNNSYAMHVYLDSDGKIEFIREFPDSLYAREAFGRDAERKNNNASDEANA